MIAFRRRAGQTDPLRFGVTADPGPGNFPGGDSGIFFPSGLNRLRHQGGVQTAAALDENFGQMLASSLTYLAVHFRDPIFFPEGDSHRLLERRNRLGADRGRVPFHLPLDFRNSPVPDPHLDLELHGVNAVFQDAVKTQGLFVEEFSANQQGATESDHEFDPQIFTTEITETTEMEKKQRKRIQTSGVFFSCLFARFFLCVLCTLCGEEIKD
jgi:hypothetical protein